MKSTSKLFTLAAIVAVAGSASAQLTGPSSSHSAYSLPSGPGAASFETKSILTVGDSVGGYKMVGIPDGLGAYDNGNGTFTVLMNHELGSTQGVTRAHGAKGAFVSSWVINKSNYSVLGGSDLITSVYGWNATTQQLNSTPTANVAFNRFCSADLPAVSAFYNSNTGLGSQERIFMHGEEGGSFGWQQATVVTGADKGKSYTLGKFNLATNGSGLSGVGAWENALANPFAQDKTIVIGLNDGGTSGTPMENSLSVYVGTKQSTGNEIEKAGLTNGTMKFVNVAGNAAEIVNGTTRATNITDGTRFSLNATASTLFSRPEDGQWNPQDLSEFYFVTTDRYDQVSDGVGTQVGQSRLWRLTFDDLTNPDAGGEIDLLVDGDIVNGSKVNMLDNMTVSEDGMVWLQEDVGGQAHNGKTWLYNPATDSLIEVLKHDTARFGDIGIAATAPFNNDEEDSGIIDISDIMGVNGTSEKVLLAVVQAHYATDAETVQGGQLYVLTQTSTPVPEPATVWTVLGLVGLLAGAQIRRRQQQG